MKLDVKKGQVEFLLETGKDIVKNTMSVQEAKALMKDGSVENSDKFTGYSLLVNNKFYFATKGEPINEESK